MSGELLRNTQNIASDQSVIDCSMEGVMNVLCPFSVSDPRNDIEYGDLVHFEYYSESVGCTRPANILLPADYSTDRKYPVLYFLHGIFGDEYSMIGDENNHINHIVKNLAIDGLVQDVIVVFPNMFATADKNLEPGFTAEQVAPYDYFINDLVGDLIPYVEREYSVYTDKKNRALAGFSMGGRETIFIGLKRSDLFEVICAIAPAPGIVKTEDAMMPHEGQLYEEEVVLSFPESEPKLFLICCGTKDGVVGKYPENYHNIFIKNKVKHLWYEVPEADHDSNAVRSGLFNLIIRWF